MHCLRRLLPAVLIVVVSVAGVYGQSARAPSPSGTAVRAGSPVAIPTPAAFMGVTFGPRPNVTNSARTPNRLTRSSAPPTEGAGPGDGLGLIEDSESPYRTAIGFQALFSNTTGIKNTASGYQALYANTTGYSNTASGVWALISNTEGFENTATGAGALYSNITGHSNTANGMNALHYNDTGKENTAIGRGALFGNTTGSQNTATGYEALGATEVTGDYNTATGAYALYSNSTGDYNTATGLYALSSNAEGAQNTATGVGALGVNKTGSRNIAIGYLAGSVVSSGSDNILVGNEGTSGDNRLIRIGKEGTHTNTWIAGIANAPLTAGSIVGVTAEGQLGTLPAGSGAVSGSLLFLVVGSTAPADYTLLGTTTLSITAPGAKRTTQLKVNVYRKQ